MYPALPFGPFTLPTAPFLALIAVIVGLEVAGRFGRRLGVHPDDVWNTGLIALLAGLIVARLWNVIQLNTVYLQEPLLIFSLRPSGFALWPGLIAALIAGYANLIRRQLEPLSMVAVYSIGLLAASTITGISSYLTAAVVGLPSDLPWALTYFDATVHPVGLYRALGSLVVLVWLWLTDDGRQPGRTVLKVLFGYSLVRLISDAFVAEAATLGELRTTQVIALAVAVVSALLLARPTPAPNPPIVALNSELEQP